MRQVPAKARQEMPRTARPRTPRAETECRAPANRPRAGPRPSPPSPRTPRPQGSPPGSARCRASSRTRRRAPSHRRPTGRPASPRRCASRAASHAIGKTPRKCSPMTMMAMPATIESSIRPGAHQRADHAGAGAERDEHRREAGDEQQRGAQRVWRIEPVLRLVVGQPLERGAGEIDQIRRHQRQHAGRQKADEAREQRGEDGHVRRHGALMHGRGAPRKRACTARCDRRLI